MSQREEYLRRVLPELSEISEAALRTQVIAAYAQAMERGGWETLEQIPFTLLVPDVETSFLDHTRSVTRMALAVADARADLDRDLVAAGALCHDIGKLLEYELRGGKVVTSAFGRKLRHPICGAALAMSVGLPDDVVHIIAVHSREGDAVVRSPEAVIIHHCDFTDFEVEKARRAMK